MDSSQRLQTSDPNLINKYVQKKFVHNWKNKLIPVFMYLD